MDSCEDFTASCMACVKFDSTCYWNENLNTCSTIKNHDSSSPGLKSENTTPLISNYFHRNCTSCHITKLRHCEINNKPCSGNGYVFCGQCICNTTHFGSCCYYQLTFWNILKISFIILLVIFLILLVILILKNYLSYVERKKLEREEQLIHENSVKFKKQEPSVIYNPDQLTRIESMVGTKMVGQTDEIVHPHQNLKQIKTYPLVTRLDIKPHPLKVHFKTTNLNRTDTITTVSGFSNQSFTYDQCSLPRGNTFKEYMNKAQVHGDSGYGNHVDMNESSEHSNMGHLI